MIYKNKNPILDVNSFKNDEEKTSASVSEKNYYKDLNKMNEYLKQNYCKFSESFELVNYINSGSAGVVYEGRTKRGKAKKIALKFQIEDKKLKETQEINILRKLHNKNITEIYAYIKMNDYSNFCALELGNLGDIEHFQKVILKRRYLSETIINYFTRQILEALDYIHRCKIVHMDIKQRNILVNSELNIKLTDFSVSCYYGSFNALDIVKFPMVGTRKYMSPEIIERAHMKIKEAEKIDIYSLGVTLYILAFDSYPYKLDNAKGKGYDDLLKNIKNEKLDFPKESKVSEIFKDFLRGLLEKDYNKRFNIKKALNHPFITASKIIFDEKENISNNESFLINLITDNISKFNDYIKNAKIISN